MTTMGEAAKQAAVHAQADSEGDDAWIPSVCSMCYNQCGILAHVVDGTLVKIEGNPESPFGRGRL